MRACPEGSFTLEDVEATIIKFGGVWGVEIPFHSLKKAIECLPGKKWTLCTNTEYSLGFQFPNPESPSHGLVRVCGAWMENA